MATATTLSAVMFIWQASEVKKLNYYNACFKNKTSRSGFALIFALFTLTILLVLTTTLVNIMMVDSRGAMRDLSSVKAFQFARSGVSRAKAELVANAVWGTTNPVSFNMNDGSYTVSVWPDPNNATNTQKLWKITATGLHNSSRRIVYAWLEQESFAKYAYFTDKELGQGGQQIWFITRDQITGYAHTNGYFSMKGMPKFSKGVTSANLTDPFWNQQQALYNQGGQSYTDPAKFYHYYTNYTSDRPTALNNSPDFSFAGAQPEVPLPVDTSMIAANADFRYNGTTTIVLKNNCTMDVTNNGSTVNQAIIAPGKTVHVTGNLTISGTLCGRLTVGTTGNITIPANLVYKDNNADILGLVAGANINIDTNPYAPLDLYIDAIMIALNNSIGVMNYNQGVPRGTLHVYGGLIQKIRGPVGTFNGVTGNIMTGYAKDYQYDPKLLITPPLNFPTTGKVKIKSWQDTAAYQN